MHIEATARGVIDGTRRVALRGGAHQDVLAVDARVASEGGTSTMVTAAQLAERWPVFDGTVYAWAKRTAIPNYRAGTQLRFNPVEVKAHFRSEGFVDEVAADPSGLENPRSTVEGVAV